MGKLFGVKIFDEWGKPIHEIKGKKADTLGNDVRRYLKEKL